MGDEKICGVKEKPGRWRDHVELAGRTLYIGWMKSIPKNTRFAHIRFLCLSIMAIVIAASLSACAQDVRDIPFNQLTPAQYEELEHVLTLEESIRMGLSASGGGPDLAEMDSLSVNQFLAILMPMFTDTVGDAMYRSLSPDSVLALRYSQSDMENVSAMLGPHISVYDYGQIIVATRYYMHSGQEAKLNQMTYAELLEDGKKNEEEYKKQMKEIYGGSE